MLHYLDLPAAWWERDPPLPTMEVARLCFLADSLAKFAELWRAEARSRVYRCQRFKVDFRFAAFVLQHSFCSIKIVKIYMFF